MSAQESGFLGASSSAPLQALARASRELGAQPDPVQALWELLCALRQDLSIDRTGVFSYNRLAHRLDHVVGVDTTGRREDAANTIPISEEVAPLMQVARREIPYYFTDDAPRDFPHRHFASGVRALAVIPIIAGDEFLGALCADNCLTGRPFDPSLLEPLFLYAGLASLPLFALFQKRERERTEAIRRRIHREVLFAVTSGKIRLCDREEIDAEWPGMECPIPIRQELDVRTVREAVRQGGLTAGMSLDRASDLGLCASEAATNALLHGNGGAAALEDQAGVLRVRVTDWGRGIDPENLPRATLLKGWSSRASMGLGFTVINEMADRVYLYTGPSGTTLIIEMAVEPAPDLMGQFNPLLWEETVSL